jgi:hypothetical protein
MTVAVVPQISVRLTAFFGLGIQIWEIKAILPVLGDAINQWPAGEEGNHVTLPIVSSPSLGEYFLNLDAANFDSALI